MLAKLPRDARSMDKSNNRETWTSGSGRGWVGGEAPSASYREGSWEGWTLHQLAADHGMSWVPLCLVPHV